MNLDNLLALALEYCNRSSSAQLCLNDALTLKARGQLDYARGRALKSLQHSIGILHADYQLATAESCEVYNSEDGCTLGPDAANISYEAARLICADWNHSGAPNLFRIRPYSPPPPAGFTGYNGFTAGVN